MSLPLASTLHSYVPIKEFKMTDLLRVTIKIQIY
jgi:hypothetical protein